MTETKAKRRGWVKNAAIIFLAVLLVLTFFSNTILNRSLPEVAAQYPTSGTINLKIRGSGNVSANQTQNVSIAESRKVKGVAIRVGDVVEEGQALFLLAEQDSEELAAAKEQLESMELNYEKALLDASATSSGSNYDILQAQLTLEEAIERRDKAKVYDSEREPLEQAVEDAAKALSEANANADLLPEKGFLDSAKEDLEKAKAAQAKAETDFNYYAELYGLSDYGGLVDKIDALDEELWELRHERDIHVFQSTIKEVVESIDGSPRPSQQVEEIKGQFDEAKKAWDDLTAEYYYDCVDIEEANNGKFHYEAILGESYDVKEYGNVYSQIQNGVYSRDFADIVITFNKKSESDDPHNISAAIENDDTKTAALACVYRSMIWWGTTYDAAVSYVDLLEQIETKEEEYWDVRESLDNPDMQDAYEAVLEANEAVKVANDDVYRAQVNYDAAIKAPSSNVEAAQKKYDDAKKQLELLEQEYEGVGSYTDEQKSVISAEKALMSLYEAQKLDEISDQKDDLDMQKQKEELEEQRAKVEELQKNASETIIYAPCAGTITAVNVGAGDTTIMNDPMAEIELTDQGHTLTFEVSKEQAARVNVGDQAEVENRWGVDIMATLVNITNSKDNPGTMKVLTFDLKGEDVVAGQNLTLSVGQKSQSYEVIIPNSALREDAQGKFVLVVRSKSTPLGNRYSVERVDVDVLAADDNNSAVKGMLTTGEFVVITSTAPLSSGDDVRLPE